MRYDRKWLKDVQDTRRDIPTTEAWISKISDVPTRGLLMNQLDIVLRDFERHLSVGQFIDDDARKVSELGILAFELVEDQRARVPSPS